MITQNEKRIDINNKRAAVVPFLFKINESTKEKELWFLMGIDNATKEITDFGGGVKKDESFEDAGKREFFEETREIFCFFEDTILENAIQVRSPLKRGTLVGMMSMFVPINEGWFKLAPHLFREAHSRVTTETSHHEIERLMWIRETNFIDMIEKINISTLKYKLWFKLRTFYRSIYSKKLRKELEDNWDKNNHIIKPMIQYKIDFRIIPIANYHNSVNSDKTKTEILPGEPIAVLY